MCMIAGYNGTKRAAPILIEMLRRSEGMNAGCFTGIATLHEGKIHYRKLAGNLDYFLAETDAMDLPGNIGIIHSRTPGGYSGDNWAHPFTCERDGEIKTALVLNGMGGCGEARNERQFPIKLRELLAAGYRLSSAGVYDGNPKHLRQCDDAMNMYHPSDIICQNVSRKILDEGLSPTMALEKSYEEVGGENMVLLLSVFEPEAISWCRLNFPMFVGFADHGACLATVPLAFADHTEQYHLLPAMATGNITKDGFTVKKMLNPPFTVASITPEIIHAAYEAVPRLIKEDDRPYSKAFAELFGPADCTEKNAVLWATLTELHRQGRLSFKKVTLPGVREGLLKTNFELEIKD